MRIVIIGNGVAGISAARHLRKRSDAEILVVSGESKHFFSRTALMYVYMGHLKLEHTKPYEDWFWEKNRIFLKQAWVRAIDFGAKQLSTSENETIDYDRLVLATGSVPRRAGWPGEDLDGVQGLYSLQDLETMEAATPSIRRACVVGGGLIGIEMAEMFSSRGIEVTMVVREPSYWRGVLPEEESAFINEEIRRHGIDLRLGAEAAAFLGDASGKVRALRTRAGEEIPCEFVGLTIGVRPNIDWLKGGELELDRGIRVNEFFETNQPDVFAIGDCAQLPDWPDGRPRVEQLWYTGRMHGEQLAANLVGDRARYKRGVWFNSAKFFDIEYQTYGEVPPSLSDQERSLCWSDPATKRLIRIVYAREDKRAVLGFNLLGIRYRQAVCQRWISEGRPIEYVLEHLGDANCDPEFTSEHEAELVAAYNNQEQPQAPLRLKRRRGLRAPWQFRFRGGDSA